MLKELSWERLEDDGDWVKKHQGAMWTKNARKMNRFKSTLLDVCSNRLGTPRERMKWKATQIANLYGIGVAEVLGEGRRKIAFRPKIRFYYWLRGQGMSFPRIGRIAGRDHTSVQHLMKRADAYGLGHLMEKKDVKG